MKFYPRSGPSKSEQLSAVSVVMSRNCVSVTPEWRGLFHSPMELAICDRLVKGCVCASLRSVRSVLCVLDSVEHMGPNLQVLGLQLQVQCVWKPIWALYSLKYLLFFFKPRELFRRRVLGSFQSCVEAHSAILCQPWRSPSHTLHYTLVLWHTPGL